MNKIKVGDRVRLLNLQGFVAGFGIGDICKVLETDNSGFYKIKIKNKEGYRGFVDDSMIKPVEEYNELIY